jgi:hypothetical protein
MASSVTADPSGVNGVEEIDAGISTGSTTQTTQTPSHSDGPLARTPSLSSFSLTEYSAKPVASVDQHSNIKKIVPDELLLPNGYPDVSHPNLHRPHHREGWQRRIAIAQPIGPQGRHGHNEGALRFPLMCD